MHKQIRTKITLFSFFIAFSYFQANCSAAADKKSGAETPRTPSAQPGFKIMMGTPLTGLNSETNASVMALASATNAMASALTKGDPNNFPQFNAALSKTADAMKSIDFGKTAAETLQVAAHAIEHPGTIGFAAQKETVEAINNAAHAIKGVADAVQKPGTVEVRVHNDTLDRVELLQRKVVGTGALLAGLSSAAWQGIGTSNIVVTGVGLAATRYKSIDEFTEDAQGCAECAKGCCIIGGGIAYESGKYCCNKIGNFGWYSWLAQKLCGRRLAQD